MEERTNYASNSNASKEKTELEEAKKKELHPVASGKTEKKGFGARMAGVLLAADPREVKGSLIKEVIIPSIRKTIADVVKNGIDMLIYGESKPNSSGKAASKISYRSYYDEEREPKSRYGYSSNDLDYDNIVFETKGDAELVLTAMDEVLGKYDVVSIADLYDLAQISTSNYALKRYGWTNLQGARIVHTRDGYMLKLPKALPID